MIINLFTHTATGGTAQGDVLSGIENITGGSAGNAASYEDLWKFTLVNYNAGPGCLGDALDLTFAPGLDLTWQNVSSQLSAGCIGAAKYVTDISE